MDSDNNDQAAFFADFMDDYYAECEEHLAVVRRDLLAFEAMVDQPIIDKMLVDELFRSFHTLKGLSSMVNVREAEELTHYMESYLRGLREGKKRLSDVGLDTLIDSVNLLEQVIEAYRGQGVAPDISVALARLAELSQNGERRDEWAGVRLPLPPEAGRSLAAAHQAGTPVWRFTFIPSAALVEQGINVNNVRERLQAIGDLLYAAPLVNTEGGIAFEFLLATDADTTAFPQWDQDGLSYSPYEAAAAALPVPAVGQPPAPSNVVRVDLIRLDELMRLLSELVISRARIGEQLAQLRQRLPANEWQTLQSLVFTMERQLRDLRDGVMQVRMVPIGDVFSRMQFVVRDLSREMDKRIRLEMHGEQTEIDKFIVDRLMDPLLHLVRNAVSHGLETAAERQAAGKPAEGTLRLQASTDGDVLVLTVSDDGRGINRDSVRRQAQKMGLIENGEALDSARLLELLSAPGFSTRDEADRASGRGIGMSVARGAVLEMGGSLEVESEPGQGSRFLIHLPLTLAIADAFIIAVGDQIFAVPQAAVTEIVEAPETAVTQMENNELIRYRGRALPLVRLARYFNLASANDKYALVLGRGLGAVGVTAARVLDRREIVVRPIVDPLINVPGISGATELGDGRPILILDASLFTRGVQTTPRPAEK